MKRVCVFGITGFSGRHFERFAASAGLEGVFEFCGFSRNLKNAERSGCFTYREADALKQRDVLEFIAEVQPDYVLNLIGAFRADSFESLLAVNVGVSHAICNAVLKSKAQVDKILLVGSAAEYGADAMNPVREDSMLRPVNIYGLSKVYQTLLAEYYYRNYALQIVMARTFNILGKELSPELSIGSFMRQINALPDGGVIKVGNISTSRDFLGIDEVSHRYWNILMKGRPGEIYNVCSGVPRTIRSVLDQLIRESGKKLVLETDPSLLKDKDIALIYGDSTKYQDLVR